MRRNKKVSIAFIYPILLYVFLILNLFAATGRGYTQLLHERTAEYQDIQLAKTYLHHAKEQYGQGNLEIARNLLNTSLSFAKISDALFLRGKLAVIEGLIEGADNYLKQAIVNDNWENYTSLEARQEMATLYYRSGLYENAYILLQPFFDQNRWNPEFAYIYIRILHMLEKNQEVIETARLLQIDFPGDHRFVKFTLTYDEQELGKATERLLAGDYFDLYSKESVRLIIELTEQDDTCEAMLQFYSDKWGQDLFYDIEHLRCSDEWGLDELNGIISRIIESADGDIELDRELLQRLYLYAQQSNNVDYLTELLVDFNGIVPFDTNKDGYYNRFDVYQAGLLVETKIGAHPNTGYEVIIEYNSLERPRKATIATGFSYIFSYARYPHVNTITLVREHDEIEYTLIPYEFSLQLFDYTQLQSPYIFYPPCVLENLVNKIKAIDTEKLRQMATKRNVFPSFGYESYFYQGAGRILEVQRNERGDILLEREYRDGFLIKERFDLNRNGRFDMKRFYQNGQLIRVEYDGTGTGIPEYMEIYNDTIIKLWDFTENGIIDCKEYEENGLLIREYSSRFNGVFDIVMHIKEGRVIEFFRNTNNIDIFYDRRNSIYWLGEAISDIYLTSSETGLITRDGRRIFLFDIFDHRFGERVD